MAGKRYKKSSGKYKKIIKNILLFITVQILVAGAFSIPMIYYGPFVNIKEKIVTTAMETLSHQYLATWFLSDSEINKIVEKYKVHDEGKVSDDKAIAVFDSSIKKDESEVKLVDISTNQIKGYILLISNPSMVSIASTEHMGAMGTKLLDIIKETGAVGGINAGGFSDDNGVGNGGTPMGLVISNGKVIYGKEGQQYQIIGFNSDSALVLGRYTLAQAKEKKIRDAVSFGPYLIVNGEPMIKQDIGTSGSLNPRTVIGQRKDGTVIMLVIDGRQVNSIGASLKDVQDIMLSYGAYNAANLDGGASTTMVYEGRIINKPSSPAGPRYLPSAFIIKQ
ncbi:phosphodiester glycosidase family protein [Clostridium sp. 19966]|uniref:phosphodiester glycosidase family protein n=1 Tax=Clostridium sp. 19966 TaxID=2768166 RepID=UPI0028EF3F44|nr:phosphodiester glycosidase family protein [Clostridium sp. 19966]